MISLIKKLIPKKVKTALKFWLYRLLRIEYSRSGLPVGVSSRLNKTSPVNFIDIGANVGHFSESVIKEFKVAKGVIIEPLPKHEATLENKFGDREKFKVLNVAVSDTNGKADFFVNEEFDSISSLLAVNHQSEELQGLHISKPRKSSIQTVTLDTVAKEFGDEIIDLIKIDVQGAEHLVLKSGTQTLKKTKMVYTEFSYKPLYENSSTFYDLYHFMYAQNYILAEVSKGYTSQKGELLQGDAIFINTLFTD